MKIVNSLRKKHIRSTSVTGRFYKFHVNRYSKTLICQVPLSFLKHAEPIIWCQKFISWIPDIFLIHICQFLPFFHSSADILHDTMHSSTAIFFSHTISFILLIKQTSSVFNLAKSTLPLSLPLATNNNPFSQTNYMVLASFHKHTEIREQNIRAMCIHIHSIRTSLTVTSTWKKLLC